MNRGCALADALIQCIDRRDRAGAELIMGRAGPDIGDLAARVWLIEAYRAAGRTVRSCETRARRTRQARFDASLEPLFRGVFHVLAEALEMPLGSDAPQRPTADLRRLVALLGGIAAERLDATSCNQHPTGKEPRGT